MEPGSYARCKTCDRAAGTTGDPRRKGLRKTLVILALVIGVAPSGTETAVEN